MMRMKDVVVGDVVSRTPHEREGWFQVGVISRMFDGKLQVTDAPGNLAVSGSDFDLIGVQVVTELELPVEEIVAAAASGFDGGGGDDGDNTDDEADEPAPEKPAAEKPAAAPERPSILAGSTPAASAEPAPPPAPPASLAPPAALTSQPAEPPASLAPPAALFAERRPTG